MSSAMEPLPSTPLVCVLVSRTDNTGVLTFTQSHGALWLVLSTVNDTGVFALGKVVNKDDQLVRGRGLCKPQGLKNTGRTS